MVIHTVKGFGIISKAEVDVFLEISCLFDDLMAADPRGRLGAQFVSDVGMHFQVLTMVATREAEGYRMSLCSP